MFHELMFICYVGIDYCPVADPVITQSWAGQIFKNIKIS